MAYARANGNVLSREILADFVGCESSNGGNKSDQVNIILSPEFEAKVDFTFSFPGNINVTVSSQPPACSSGTGELAFHSGQLGTANFTVIPTKCNLDLDSVARGISHEMVELVANPAAMGYFHVDGGGDQFAAIASNPSVLNTGELGDICEPGGLKNPGGSQDLAYVEIPSLNGSNALVRAARYWSNIDNSCQPQHIMTDTLVNDGVRHRLGTGGGMTADLTYPAPYLNGSKNDRQVVELMLSTLTADDNLCNESSLDVHVVLKNGRKIDFSHVNSVENWNAWDNNEAHAVNLPVPTAAGQRFTVGDIASIQLHDQSGHCTSDPFATDDGWNVARIQVLAALGPAPPPPNNGAAPKLSLVLNESLFKPTLATSQSQVQSGKSIAVNGLNFPTKPASSIALTWSANVSDGLTLSNLRGLPPGDPASQPRTPLSTGAYTVNNIAPNTTYNFQVEDCNADGCTQWSNTLNYKSGSLTAPGPVQLVLQQGAKNIPLTTVTATNGAFSANITVGATVVPGSYMLVAQSGGQTLASTPIVVVAANHFNPVIQFVDPTTGTVSSSTRIGVDGSLTVRGEGFNAGPVKLTLDTATGATLTTVNAAGSPPVFNTTFRFNYAGTHAIVASQSAGSNKLQATATVTAQQIQ